MGHTSLREKVTGAKCLTVLQLGLLLQRIPLPAFLFHFRVQVRREQRQGRSLRASIPTLPELQVEEGFIFPFDN